MIILVFVGLMFHCNRSWSAPQGDIIQAKQEFNPFGRPSQTPAKQEGKEAPKNKSENKDDAAPLVQPKVEKLPPTYMRLHLLDGDIVSGELETQSIAILTDFGTLTVPVEKIIRFEPGLNSYPQIVEHIGELVNQLGSAKYEERESAHKELVGLGPKISSELANYKDDDNAERKRHLEEIKKEIAKALEELDEDELEDPEYQPWVRHDKLITSNFTAVGKIQQAAFKVTSKYGQFSINLSDVRKGTRPSGTREAKMKNLVVNKDNFVQLSWKSAGLVEKGDSISVTAKGSMVLTPWGSNVSSTPQGTPQYGVMPNTPSIPYGALVAKIGNGKYFLVGDKKRFKADAKGKLQFAITMRASYVGRTYQFPGDYKVKVKIQPGGE